MVSLAIRRTSKLAAGAFIFAAVASHAAFPQSRFEPIAKDEQQRQIVETIREEQALNGPYSTELLGPFSTLGLLYQESGDHGLAIAALDRALQVVRANYGLRSLDQAPLLRQSIRSEEARGNFADAWDLEQDLLLLAHRSSSDLRIVPILHEIADKRIDVLQRYLGGEFPPQIALGCFYNPARSRRSWGSRSGSGNSGSCHSGQRSVVVQALATEAVRYYLAAIGVLLQHQRYSSAELRELETAVLRNLYLYGRNPALGRESLHRLLTYDAANAAPWRTRVESFIQLVDWDLLYAESRSSADPILESYEAAYAELAQEGIAQAEIDEFFSPETPVVIPAFLPNPLASEKTPGSNGHIDVSFAVTRYGRGRKIEILDSTTNATKAEETRLVRLIARSRFRPRITDGRLAETSPVVLRYYLSDPEPAR